jgi:hypothetical protein
MVDFFCFPFLETARHPHSLKEGFALTDAILQDTRFGDTKIQGFEANCCISGQHLVITSAP